MTWWSLAWTASPLWLAVNALAAYRLTRLWVADMLPPLPRLRQSVEAWAHERWAPAQAKEREQTYLHSSPPSKMPPDSDHELTSLFATYGGTPPLAYLVTCAWCSGYWISLAVFLLATLFPAAVWAFVAVPLAFSAVTGLLHHATE